MRKKHGRPGFVQATPGSQLRSLVFPKKRCSQCDLPRYLSSKDVIWFKRIEDTLWYNKASLDRLGNTGRKSKAHRDLKQLMVTKKGISWPLSATIQAQAYALASKHKMADCTRIKQFLAESANFVNGLYRL